MTTASPNCTPPLTLLTPDVVQNIRAHSTIPSSIVVAIGNPIGLILAGLRRPKAVVLVEDPLFPGLAQQFKELMGEADSASGASLILLELIANLEILPKESAAFETLLNQSWCSEEHFAFLKECSITCCRKVSEVHHHYPNEPIDLLYLGGAISAAKWGLESLRSPPVSPGATGCKTVGFNPEHNVFRFGLNRPAEDRARPIQPSAPDQPAKKRV